MKASPNNYPHLPDLINVFKSLTETDDILVEHPAICLHLAEIIIRIQEDEIEQLVDAWPTDKAVDRECVRGRLEPQPTELRSVHSIVSDLAKKGVVVNLKLAPLGGEYHTLWVEGGKEFSVIVEHETEVGTLELCRNLLEADHRRIVEEAKASVVPDINQMPKFENIRAVVEYLEKKHGMIVEVDYRDDGVRHLFYGENEGPRRHFFVALDDRADPTILLAAAWYLLTGENEIYADKSTPRYVFRQGVTAKGGVSIEVGDYGSRFVIEGE